MKLTYALFLVTFFGHPFIAGVLIAYFGDASYYKGNARIRKCIALSIPFFLLYDAACYFGYTFSGDYADYIAFSLQYLAICLFIESIKRSRKIGLEIVRIGGYLLMACGALIGLIGIVSALPLTNGCFDKEFVLKTDKHNYMLRRYSDYELAPSVIRYTFSLYRQYGPLPIEKLVNESKGEDQAVDMPLDPEVRIIDSANNRHYLFIKTVTDTATITAIE
jgi:hypothetical protein